MREFHHIFTENGAELSVIAPSSGSVIKEFNRSFGPYPFSLYGDPKHEAYYDLGHIRMPKWKMAGMLAGGAATKRLPSFFPSEKRQKQFVTKSMRTQDVYLQGGAWIVDKDGELLYSHIDKNPMDHAPIDDMYRVLTNHRLFHMQKN
ncbi:AhpC/TSA family protein [Alkalicoccus urumqiensis]|uniref:AhpC/TSA family protein n=1 Tax=Alkalicoccus urumqiensis TaxID=1548213 RepID=UPI0015E5C546|nr:AhpC/TSA family protein [Alkalicoccus urumqiensis]